MAETAKKMNIYEAISKCMEDIGAVGKNDRNKQQGFMYRGIDAVMNAINPALTKNHVFVVPEVLEQQRQERTTQKGAVLIYSICKVKFTFYAEDGSSVSAVTIGEGMDSGDKATNKAMSIAFKYACFQVFCIPTEEMQDPDAETPDHIKPKEPEQPMFVPATAEQLRKMADFVTAYADTCKNAEEKDIWAKLKEMYHFNSTGEISAKNADMIILQVETWYKNSQKKEAE